MSKTVFFLLLCFCPVLACAQDYETQDTILTDVPIIYGTNMNDEDRQKAWKHLFEMMAKAVFDQQGTDVLSLQLAQRCQPGQDWCAVILSANLVGIGGIQEPRKVLVMVAFDADDLRKQRSRIVCTWPAQAVQVCRDFDTGKLVKKDEP